MAASSASTYVFGMRDAIENVAVAISKPWGSLLASQYRGRRVEWHSRMPHDCASRQELVDICLLL